MMATPMTAEQARECAIAPIRVKDLAAFLGAIEPIAHEALSGDITAALIKHADKVIEATAIGARVPRQELDDAPLDVLVVLATRVVEVNADFFAMRVLPEVTAAAERLGATFASLSTTGSSPSAVPASTTAA